VRVAIVVSRLPICLRPSVYGEVVYPIGPGL